MTAFIGLLLLANGSLAAWLVEPLHYLVEDSGSPYTTAESVAQAKELLPFLYLTAAQGIGFGIVAIVSAYGSFRRRKWAVPALLSGSIGLAIAAAVAIAMVPHSWDIQGAFALFSGLLWWEHWRRRNGPAFAGRTPGDQG